MFAVRTERNGKAKVVARHSITGDEFCFLRPCIAAAGVHVGAAGHIAVLDIVGCTDERVPALRADRDGVAEATVRHPVAREQPRSFRPHRFIAHEDVGTPEPVAPLVVSGGTDEGIPAVVTERDGVPELIDRLAIGGGELDLLYPLGPVAHKDIDTPGPVAVLVIVVGADERIPGRLR